jgi:hypothetical protein
VETWKDVDFQEEKEQPCVKMMDLQKDSWENSGLQTCITRWCAPVQVV